MHKKIIRIRAKAGGFLEKALPYFFMVAATVYLADFYVYKSFSDLIRIELLAVCAAMFITIGSNSYARKAAALNCTITRKMKMAGLMRRLFFWFMIVFFCALFISSGIQKKELPAQAVVFLMLVSPVWALAHYMNMSAYFNEAKKEAKKQQNQKL